MGKVRRIPANPKALPKNAGNSDSAVLEAIREITKKGHDAEVKLKPDGTFRVYEVKRTSYP